MPQASGHLGASGALKKLLEFKTHRLPERFGVGTHELLSTELSTQANHMRGRRPLRRDASGKRIDLAFDGIARHGPACPPLRHHGAQPRSRRVKESLRRP